ncbi:MAG: pyruvate formate lyase family protein, partial [Chloroflexota bacterium]|nr:pyruvate formate lyase family protein [Chloroflexota bacterium]
MMARLDEGLLSSIDSLSLSDRLKSFKEMFFSCQLGVASERITLAMESWQETEGEPLDIRSAKKLAKIAGGIPVVIHLGELLVGSHTKYYRGADPHCDFDGAYMEALMAEGGITLGGPMWRGSVTPEDWQAIDRARKFFKGKTCVEQQMAKVDAATGGWYDDAVEAGAIMRETKWAQWLDRPNFARVFATGLRGIIGEATERIKQSDNRESDAEKLHFWQAVTIAGNAVITLAHRYARRAGEMASTEADPNRRTELEEIARTLEWVPENPPRSFQEACQTIVFLHLSLFLENGVAPPMGLGLIDQLLYPYFKKDIAEGRLTVEKAADLIGGLLIYLARQERVAAIDWREYIQKGPFANVTLAGLTRDGQDASSEMTYLILHMAGLMKLAEPHIPVRWHRGIPRQIMLKAIETNIRAGGGVPQFQNSEHIVKYMVARGVTLENARDWGGGGCSQATPADEGCQMIPQVFNVALAVDLALHNGVSSTTGKRIGPETGDPTTFDTFDRFYAAFKKQCEFIMRKAMAADRIAFAVQAQSWRRPLASALLPGCMEKGKDFAAGGLPSYRMWFQKDRGLIPAADSLMAIKKLVFDDKKVAMTELVQTLDANFDGRRGEEIRQMCLAVPKYGNDIVEVDELLKDVAKFTAGVIFSEKNIFGYPYAINRNGQGWHFSVGKKMGALPCGRKAGEPLA